MSESAQIVAFIALYGIIVYASVKASRANPSAPKCEHCRHFEPTDSRCMATVTYEGELTDDNDAGVMRLLGSPCGPGAALYVDKSEA